jgi:hypothetical protein
MKFKRLTRAQLAAAGTLGLTALVAASGWAPASATTTPRVLRVGMWHGIRGNYPTLEAAVAALRPGDFLLIGPGDWHPRMDYLRNQLGVRYPSALLITTPDVTIRGMDRNRVIIDGTKPGAPKPCASNPRYQDYGAIVSGQHQGRNGPEALYTSGVKFENFTACNFLTGTADTGNEIWWNGGDDGGKVRLGSWYGSYLSATSTFFDMKNPSTAALYGLFVSNSRGPGEMDWTYASNMGDSDYYIGACPDCNGIINHGHAETAALGLSSTNAGGHLIIENSEWDQNKTGMVTNTQDDADPPTPQNGMCPHGGTGPYGTNSCTIWRNNYVHDNNNPDVPYSGTAALGPTGTGMIIAGVRNTTIIDNRVEHNDAWGLAITMFPNTDQGSPHNVSFCHGGEPNFLPPDIAGNPVPCVFDSFTNHIVKNHFAANGSFGSPTDGDIVDISYGTPPEQPGAGGDCYTGNVDPTGLTTSPTMLAQVQTSCANPAAFPNLYAPAEYGAAVSEVACDTQALSSLIGNCPQTAATNYPPTTKVVLKPLPAQQSMPNPCAGVPANPWCDPPSGTRLVAASLARPVVARPAVAVRATAGTLPATGLPDWLPFAASALVSAGAIGWRLQLSAAPAAGPYPRRRRISLVARRR